MNWNLKYVKFALIHVCGFLMGIIDVNKDFISLRVCSSNKRFNELKQEMILKWFQDKNFIKATSSLFLSSALFCCNKSLSTFAAFIHNLFLNKPTKKIVVQTHAWQIFAVSTRSSQR